ncbi:MAG: gfo/Idh/MocA family oxidoreductase [Acidobacteria bacterium]|nr:MAG: gfo/Idh/MocA family oxidoreductase [Acidobacteriota bacterium]
MNRRRFITQVAVGTGAASVWTAKSYAAVQGANERLRIGVIGCGGMANSHMDALVKMTGSDNIEITAVCDIYKKRMDAAVAKTGGKPYPKYLDLLKQKDVDYVLIATPEHWHHQMVLDALDAGKHVYVEKPMTHTIEQSKEVVAKVKKSGLKLQVGVQGMSDESYEVANQHIKAGELGKIVMAQIDYSRNYAGDFWAYEIDSEAKPGVNLDWDAWLGPAPKRPWDPRRYFQWRRYWDYSGGIATDLFIHRVTRILKAVGLTFPDYVVGTGGTWQFVDSVAEIPDTFNILSDYPGGPTVALISSMGNDTPIDHVIRGHKATLEFTRSGFTITPQEVSSADTINPSEAKKPEAVKYQKKGAEDVTLHHRNLQAAIRKGEPLKCDADLGYQGVVVTMMGVTSFRDRKYMKWDAKAQKAVAV